MIFYGHKKIWLFLTLYICSGYASTAIDELLERTHFAQLIGELIGLTDTLALLEHPRTDPYDKRFLEDSILGKLMRARIHLHNVHADSITSEEIMYAQSWIALASQSTKQQFLLEQFAQFEQEFESYFAH